MNIKLSLAELKVLKDMAPDEANVHYLLGKVYKQLHDKANAIKHFTTALNLDPKVSVIISFEKSNANILLTGSAVYQRCNGNIGRRRG